MSFRIEPLTAQHDRSTFSCGAEALDRYLKQQASQDTRRRASACYVALSDPDDAIAGYFTLSASSIPLTELPDAITRRLPRYPSVPVALLVRLAIDQHYQGHKLGSALLGDAARRAARSELMAYALVVDAKDESARSFYLHHGFVELRSNPLQLFLPIASIAAALEK